MQDDALVRTVAAAAAAAASQAGWLQFDITAK
jgi:hypothetical protein